MGKKIKMRWLLAYFMSHIYVKVIYRNKLTFKDDIKVNKDKPFMLLGNHSCFYDFLFAVNAVGPYPIKFVVASKYFANPVLRWVLKLYGAIPKKLAEKDIECIKKIMSSLNNGESVAIYPEGRVSMWGCTEYISPATAKLVKKYGCDLVLVQNLGGFFVSPPYGGGTRVGKTQSNVSVYSGESLVNKSIEEINSTITSALDVDQYDWYRKDVRSFLGKDKLGELPNLLYRCPACGSLGSLMQESNKLVCDKCELEGSVKDCLISWSMKDIPQRISDIYSFFKEFEKKQMVDEGWSIDAECSIEIMDLTTGKVTSHEKCSVSMDIETLKISLLDKEVEIKNKLIDYLPFDVGDNFQIYRNGKLYAIKPYKKALPSAFSVIHEATKEYNKYMVKAKIAN